MSTHYRICNCNRTMPLDAASGRELAAALGGAELQVATDLCRREVLSLLPALEGVDQVVVGCTQERALFAEISEQKQSVAPLTFVNLRESGGWSSEGRKSLPKMAALLAAGCRSAPPPPPPAPDAPPGAARSSRRRIRSSSCSCPLPSR